MIKPLRKIAGKILLKLGYQLTKIRPQKIFPKDYENIEEEFKEIYECCRPYTMTSVQRIYALFKSVEYIVKGGIPGDFVECGVYKGGSCMAIAKTLLLLGQNQRKIYLYDTFSGMPEPSLRDKKIYVSLTAVDKWKQTKSSGHNEWCYAQLEEARVLMASTGYPEENIIFVKGKVEETIPGVIPAQISLLRLDTDWYESTLHEMKYLFPRLAHRGVLLLDDYDCWRGVRDAVDEYFAEHKIIFLLNRLDDASRIGIKVE